MRFFLLVCLGLGLAACGGDGGGGGGGEDTTPAPVDTVVGDGEPGESVEDAGAVGETWYTITLDLERGPGVACDPSEQVDCLEGATCCRSVLERDLTGLAGRFSFGSTHIAPAVALAMEDHVYNPFMGIITLNFGIIIGTAELPPACPGSGTYPFSGFEPEIKVFIQNKNFGSKLPGAAGETVVDVWGAETGDAFSGSFAGILVQDTTKADKLRCVVSGEYHFVLPDKAAGQ
ncbi:MAG: hypothetical protein ABIK09_12710 [Pseudomonadota bacterium]